MTTMSSCINTVVCLVHPHLLKCWFRATHVHCSITVLRLEREICVDSSWRSQQLSYQHLSRRSPRPHIEVLFIRPAIIGVHTITCRDPSARHGLVPAHLFPGETGRDINVGHAGQQPLVWPILGSRKQVVKGSGALPRHSTRPYCYASLANYIAQIYPLSQRSLSRLRKISDGTNAS
jgi:hypothetical protein